MVSLSEFLHGVQLNAHRVTKYEWGEDGSKMTEGCKETEEASICGPRPV